MIFSVAKFGGTSMANAEIILKSSKVLLTKTNIRVCVISATSGSTNQLNRIATLIISANHEDVLKAKEDFAQFSERHLTMAKDLGAQSSSLKQIQDYLFRVQEMMEGFRLLKEVSLSSLDEFLSFGEMISSILFYEALLKNEMNATWVDVRPIMKTSSEFGKATPHLDLLKNIAKEIIFPLLKETIVVTQGYIGSDLKGKTTTLGKEGSDYSTALIAEALNASEVQIWKDVPGIMTTDPRIVKEAKTINHISFNEVSELTRFGAKVIHPDTFLPIMRQNIPLFVGYSQNPEIPGTKITKIFNQDHKLHAITMKKKMILSRVAPKAHYQGIIEFDEVFSIYKKDNKHPLFTSTSFDHSVLIYDEKDQLSDDAQKELEHHFTVSSHSDLHLVSLIGQSLSSVHFLNKLIPSLEVDIHYWSINQSLTSLSFLVDEKFGENIVKKLHKVFLESK